MSVTKNKQKWTPDIIENQNSTKTTAATRPNTRDKNTTTLQLKHIENKTQQKITKTISVTHKKWQLTTIGNKNAKTTNNRISVTKSKNNYKLKTNLKTYANINVNNKDTNHPSQKQQMKIEKYRKRNN